MSYFLRYEEDYTPGFCYKGGGGSAGAVSFPDYMETRHQDWLGSTAVTSNVSQLINVGLATNPLENVSYNDPVTEITDLNAEQDLLETLSKGADADVDYSAAVAEAAAEVDTLGVLNEIDATALVQAARTESFETTQAAVLAALEAIDDGRVFEAVKAFVESRRLDRSQRISQYKANMANLNAERGSAYAMGLALLEIEFQRETTQFQETLSLEMYRQGLQAFATSFATELRVRIAAASQDKQSRDQLLGQGIQLHLQYQQFIFEMRRNVVALLAEVKRIGFVMDSEFVANTADLNWKFASWDWNVYQNATNILGGIGGGQFVPEGPTKAASAIGGALSGAGAGGALVGGLAAAGVAAPPLGLALALGGALGGLAGLF